MKEEIVKTDEWYILLVESCRLIIAEAIHISRIELIKGKWLVGQVIEVNAGNFKRSEIYGAEINKKVAHDLGVSDREIRRCRQFYRKFPAEDVDKAVQMFSEEENISWNKVITRFLPEVAINEKEINEETIRILNHCPNCNYEW